MTILVMLQLIKFKLGHDTLYVDLSPCIEDGKLNIELVKVEVACSYFLQLPEQKRSKGMCQDSRLVKFFLPT